MTTHSSFCAGSYRGSGLPENRDGIRTLLDDKLEDESLLELLELDEDKDGDDELSDELDDEPEEPDDELEEELDELDELEDELDELEEEQQHVELIASAIPFMSSLPLCVKSVATGSRCC